MKRQKITDNNGVGLLEVMVSMIIISIGLLGLAPLVVTSIEGNVISQDISTAGNLIKQSIEFYEGLDSISSVPLYISEDGLQNRFLRTTHIWDNTTDTLVPNDVYCIEVDVSWVDHKSVSHSRNYSTYILKD
ncbi:MAG: hypothetical protein DRP47_01880 [Candidatus Zixiibacteriota bacterium]|nr:MAG: hypothetical protein DRP47_01880 [candidate division Zixibacteria bacterium]